MKLKIVLLTASLSLSGCAGWWTNRVPEFPEVLQCGYSAKWQKFRCKNTRTKEVFDLPLNHPMMEGAQALPIADKYRSYSSSEAWVAAVKSIAEERCK